jgi:hypothetical protein
VERCRAGERENRVSVQEIREAAAECVGGGAVGGQGVPRQVKQGLAVTGVG